MIELEIIGRNRDEGGGRKEMMFSKTRLVGRNSASRKTAVASRKNVLKNAMDE